MAKKNAVSRFINGTVDGIMSAGSTLGIINQAAAIEATHWIKSLVRENVLEETKSVAEFATELDKISAELAAIDPVTIDKAKSLIEAAYLKAGI